MTLHSYHLFRAAQRAFRERKQSQLAELQAKVQQYEQGEIERNVALQNIAKRLKEENDKLRRENTLLQEKLANVEQERETLRELSRKRWRDESPLQSFRGIPEAPTAKRARMSDPFDSMSPTPMMPSPYISSPISSASSPESIGHTSFSPTPGLPPPRDMPIFPQGNALSNIFDFISTGKTSVFEPGGPLETFDCGFCSDNTPCVCRELALQQAGEQRNPPITTFKVESDHRTDLRLDGTQLSSQNTILDNLPAYQPPVPLRRRGNPKPASNSIFTIQSSSSPVRPAVASCTGDPSNCLACADDAFGKAFCAAISKSVSSPCNDCPSGPSGSSGGGGCGGSSNGGCCGNPAGCGRGRESAPSSAPTTTVISPRPEPMVIDGGTIPCDDAWRQIKSHPNVEFADLDLLAEVVARRSKCTGPRVEIFPAPGTITPERGISPLTVLSQVPAHPGPISQAALANARNLEAERERARASPSLQLVPQEVLVQCGRKRIREVNADGVRDALHLLDVKFSMS